MKLVEAMSTGNGSGYRASEDNATMQNSDSKILTLPIAALLVFVICTFYPLIYTYFPILGKIQAVLFAGIIMLVGYIITKGAYREIGSYQNGLFWMLTGFVLSVLLSLMISLDRGKTLDFIIVNAKYYIIVAVMIKIIDNDRRLKLFFGVLSACGIGMALSTVLNYLVGQTVSHSGYTSSRALSVGIFADPNDLALLYNSTLPFILYFWISAKRKVLFFLGILIIISAIILTFSRGGFLGLCAVGVGFYLFYAKRQKRFVVCTFLLIVMFIYLAPPEYAERISTIFGWEVDPHTGETGTRMDAWRHVFIETITNNPIMGVGAGCSHYIAGRGMNDWHYIHNTFIQVLSELGFVGTFFYLGMFFLPYRHYRASFQLENKEGNWDLLRFRMILVSFFAYAVTVIFLPQAYSPILYMLVGIAVIQTQLIRGKMQAKVCPKTDNKILD